MAWTIRTGEKAYVKVTDEDDIEIDHGVLSVFGPFGRFKAAYGPGAWLSVKWTD